jgi:hypothetical protein
VSLRVFKAPLHPINKQKIDDARHRAKLINKTSTQTILEKGSIEVQKVCDKRGKRSLIMLEKCLKSATNFQSSLGERKQTDYLEE